MGPQHTHIITFGCQLSKQQKKCKAINVIISDEAKTLNFFGQMYKSDYFTKEQMTTFKILPDADKVWDKTLAHFTDLYARRKAYGDDRAANSGFKSAAHVRDDSSSGNSAGTTANNLTRELYVESLEEFLTAVREYMAKDTSAPPATPPAITNQVTLLRNDLDSQCKQFELVMEQNSKLLAALSKGGGGGSSGRSSGKGGGGKTAHREKKLCTNRNKMVVHYPANCYSLEANKDKRPKGWTSKPAV
jgi:hypothetical protein